MTIDLLKRGVNEIIVQSSLEEKLKSGRKLRIKYGIDPNRPDIHLGHAVPIRKLKCFQELGHKAVFIIGDYTASIGDPSGKDETRLPISEKTIKENAGKFFAQAFKILDRAQTEIHLQSEWFGKIDLTKLIEMFSKVTLAQIMEHETFRERIEKKQILSLHEVIYPILQGYDSVAVKADVELGGADQKFNLLMGRQMQKAYSSNGQEVQDILMMNYLIGLDGKEKMSKSLGNYIALNDPPQEMYGKVMSIPDKLILPYYELCTDITLPGLKMIEKELNPPTRGGKNPRDLKAKLAYLIVQMYHSAQAAEKAAGEFDKIFSKRERPTEIPTKKINFDKLSFEELLLKTELASSKSEARRFIEQGGAEINAEKITDPKRIIEIKDEMVIKVGKRNFVRIKK